MMYIIYELYKYYYEDTRINIIGVSSSLSKANEIAEQVSKDHISSITKDEWDKYLDIIDDIELSQETMWKPIYQIIHENINSNTDIDELKKADEIYSQDYDYEIIVDSIKVFE